MRVWLENADIDLRAGFAIVAADLPSYETASFHAQQAAEKALKAFLIRHQVDFTKTHDLGQLWMLAAAAGLGASVEPAHIDDLTPYAVDARYPRIGRPSLQKADAVRHLEVAEDAVDRVRAALASYVGGGVQPPS